MISTIFCLADSAAHAERIVSGLEGAGFDRAGVSVLMAGNADSAALARELHVATGHGTVTGAAVGGTIGWLVGVTALAIPGIGPFIAVGPLLGLLGGAGLGAAVGDLKGGLMELGIPQAQTGEYAEALQRSQVLVAVNADGADQERAAFAVFQAAHAMGIGTSCTAAQAAAEAALDAAPASSASASAKSSSTQHR